jgi:nucleotide-binding universal stress UspA family protein
VLLVPNGAKFKAYRNVVYASDFERIDSRVMDKIVDFAGRFSAGIHLVDVHESREKGRYKVSEQLLEQQLNDQLPKLEFKMAEVESSSIWEGLDQYALDNEVDLLVMVTKHRKFWENLVHKSITRQVALHSKLPILILHVDEDQQ